MKAFIAVAFIAVAGCYHATVETGATPSSVVVDKPWASSWIYGLVPPSVVSTAQRCPDGVAKVETQHTFLNQLVGFLTLGIYTPMQITVTCAARGSASADGISVPVVIKGATAEAKQEALNKAVTRAVATRKPVYLQF